MRPSSLILVAVVCAGCTVRVPQPPGVRISVKGTVHARGQVHVAQPGQPAQPEPPPQPPPAPVALVNAPVVEFFGIPLEGAADIVFVLDRSGSMDALARGRLAEIPIAPPGPPTEPPTSEPPPQMQPGPPTEPPPSEPLSVPQLSEPVPSEPAMPAQTKPRKIDVAKAELIDALQRLPAGTRINVIFFDSSVDGYAPHLVTLDDASRADLVGFVHEVVADGQTALSPAMRVAFLMNARRIVLLSDGLGNVGGNSWSLIRDAREAIRGGVRIDAIGVGADQDMSLLRTLASESGGLYQAL